MFIVVDKVFASEEEKRKLLSLLKDAIQRWETHPGSCIRIAVDADKVLFKKIRLVAQELGYRVGFLRLTGDQAGQILVKVNGKVSSSKPARKKAI